MANQERALDLVERIYAAVVEPDAWHGFLESLSEALGGAAIQLSLRIRGELPAPDALYRIGLEEAYHEAFVKHVVEGLPWGSVDHEIFRGRFGLASDIVTDEGVADSAFYLEYMKPQGLAPEWPICHLIGVEHGLPLAGIVIYRREGGRPIDVEDLQLLDSLVVHLDRAYALHCRLRENRQQRQALAEVIDRLPTGVILVGADGRQVLMNRTAERIIELDDGFRLERGRPCATYPHENQLLQELIERALSAPVDRVHGGETVMTISRPSGRRPLPLLVAALLAAPSESNVNEARAILFIRDPESGQIHAPEMLETLYQLTHAEAELLRLIAEGRSLEEVASARNVTMNTVRSQLKQVFSKTDTRRQGELVHLVLTGVASILDSEPAGTD